jgi:NAD(P)-dependent dehydrogenase (short-subunit alcohol dehydrogenase family)
MALGHQRPPQRLLLRQPGGGEHFRKQESGAFVHITSTSGLIGNFGQANYSAAKLGIVALSSPSPSTCSATTCAPTACALRLERMTSSIPAETPEQKARVERLMRMGPEKNAPLAVFLASDAAKGGPGQIFAPAHARAVSVQPEPPHSLGPLGTRLDAGENRRDRAAGHALVLRAP